MKTTFTLVFLVCMFTAKCQLLTWNPAFIQESSTPIDIILDGSKGNKDLMNFTDTNNVYVHTGVITNYSTSSSDWKHAPFTWATSPALGKCTYLGNNKYKFTITGGLRSFYSITDAAEKVLQIAILFRNAAGTKVARNSDGGDMYVPVYTAGLNVRIDEPYKQPKYSPVLEPITKTLGDNVAITAKASTSSDLKIFFNGVQVGATVLQNTTISRTATITSYGTQTIVAQASGTAVKNDTVTFFVSPPINIAPLPANVRDGINYETGDTSVTLVLFAPSKQRVAVLGDFSNWQEMSRCQMNRTPDSSRYWLRITGLTPGTEYAYQYLIDGSLKVADYMTEKVLDPSNDQYIPAANYPNLKPYPTGLTTGIVSVLQTAKPTYNWQVQNFAKPNKRNLIIYELLVRDFVATQNWQTVKDSIAYLKRLGINAIEVMPFNEFEGNNSWGYNSEFFLAPDKMYGTESALKQFIDECHKQGIAVIMDIAMNHAFGLSPTVQMYWDAANNRPATNSPWHNPVAKHPFNVGFDFNHESTATKALVARVIELWLTKYKIDGFRWDLSKGFTQVNSCTTANCDQSSEVSNWGNYDASRVAIWKRYYDTMQAKAPNSYCILEHFASNTEEIELSNYGMLLWGNANYNYNEATMGYVSTSNFSGGIYTSRGWTQPNLVTYMESHDEERLMYKNLQYGNIGGTYNIKDLNTALKRCEMAAAFWAVTPAPKMMWQFGELGYDYSINTCEDLTVNNNCRLSPKPIRWDYLNNANRQSLMTVYSKLFKMRNVPNYLPTFTTNNVTYDLSSGFKWLKVTSDSLKIVVIGNFDVSTVTGSVTFQQAGTWYNYLQGGVRTATGLAESFTLQPGEYYVYVSRNVAAAVTALPLNLLSFTAKKAEAKNMLTWTTSHEVNVKQFSIERSFNGSEFSGIGTVLAQNTQRQNAYAYNDNDPIAYKASGKVFYRLKMMDIDGSYTYSSIVVVNPSGNVNGLTVYPNPARAEQIFIETGNMPLGKGQLTISDASGRLLLTQTINVTSADQQIPVNVRKLMTGVYVLKLITDKTSFTKQIIIQP